MDLLNRIPQIGKRSKAEILDIMLREEYGYLPPAPQRVLAKTVRESTMFGEKALLRELELTCEGEFGSFTFPIQYVAPRKREGKLPGFVHINFRPELCDPYRPLEEIIDRGYAIACLYYQDVTTDNGDFTNGLAGVLYPDGKRTEYQCGKIGMWAWACAQVLEYLLTLPELDHSRISVIGHSRLGKTALLAGAVEERFFCAISNDSGCSGAALSREKGGESIDRICTVFPYWFSEHYQCWRNREEEAPFDQHFLIAANWPHRVCVGSAEEDLWADPMNEYRSCAAASQYYRDQGQSGFVHPWRLPKPGDCFPEGEIAYHLRSWGHALSREDWNLYINYLDKHR